MTVAWLSRPRDVPLPSKLASINDGNLESQIFRLLHRGDLSMSTAWHSIWHGLERTL